MTIKDSGTGIDPEILPRLFTKFATKSEEGTGLGHNISILWNLMEEKYGQRIILITEDLLFILLYL